MVSAAKAAPPSTSAAAAHAARNQLALHPMSHPPTRRPLPACRCRGEDSGEPERTPQHLSQALRCTKRNHACGQAPTHLPGLAGFKHQPREEEPANLLQPRHPNCVTGRTCEQTFSDPHRRQPGVADGGPPEAAGRAAACPTRGAMLSASDVAKEACVRAATAVRLSQKLS